MSGETRVAICLVTWNGGSLAVECLRAALRQDQPGVFVVVVDNNSSPEDRAALQACAAADPRVEFVWNESNRGFAAAANQGLGRALARGAGWVLLVTQDTILEPTTCRVLLDTARQIPGLGIAGPVVFDRGTQRALSLGERTNPLLLAVPRSLVRYRSVQKPYRIVQGVVGCCFLVAARCWQDVGGFREDLFAYYEEVDLCLRARQRGYRVAVVQGARAEHAGWRGFRSGLEPLSAALKSRNLILVLRDHLRPWQWSLVLPSLVALLAGSVFLYAVRGKWNVVRSMAYGLWLGVKGEGGAMRDFTFDSDPCALP